ncbi:hypothetical protein [uncultured Roseovarius sp.]|uniref:hypothetical protein n=1 Tax=uncultured Roseovarius sp. TaxID=293344 RepID=UPI002592D793|nr:hypothetical protein [uncultured Roseovarius sp.]
MTMNSGDLLKQIEELTIRHWNDHHQPLLLSRLGSEILSEGIEYKEILEGSSLGEFIAQTSEKVRIVKHPQQFAKIGVVPTEETFEYPADTSQPAQNLEGQDRVKRTRRAFYNFIEAISDLPVEDIEKISIPTHVIVQLLEGKK